MVSDIMYQILYLNRELEYNKVSKNKLMTGRFLFLVLDSTASCQFYLLHQLFQKRSLDRNSNFPSQSHEIRFKNLR